MRRKPRSRSQLSHLLSKVRPRPLSPGQDRIESDLDSPCPDSPTPEDFIEGLIAPDLSADEGEIRLRGGMFEDALHEFGVKKNR